MGMNLCLGLIQTLEMVGGVTSSIFPKVELWLQSDDKHYQALQMVSSRKNMERYHSVIDFIFCETWIQWRSHCFRYYEDKRPLLKEFIPEHQRYEYEMALLLILDAAWICYVENWRLNGWKEFLITVADWVENQKPIENKSAFEEIILNELK